MSEERPSNIIIKVFWSLVILLAAFVIGSLTLARTKAVDQELEETQLLIQSFIRS
ncbi:MAG: hypothetical protein RBJ76_02485 [Stenomitos frigidus ULC029]